MQAWRRPEGHPDAAAARSGGTLALLLAAALALGGAGLAIAQELGSSGRVTPGLVAHFVQRFGNDARPRLSGWTEFGATRRGAVSRTGDNAAEQLGPVNTYFNRVPWIEDDKHWGQADYWATPGETVASHGGDCEDFSIAKYFMLKELGVPVQRLRITYVRAARSRQPHMVLAYYDRPDGEPLILDNLDPAVRRASERTDLTPVYSFNDEDVVMVGNGAKANPMGIRAWRAVIERLQAEAKL